MIEYIATTIEDAILIEQSGADRIELVSALTEGGLTPSYALIEEAVNRVNIPVNIMVRPHSQSFDYSMEDILVMKRDIQMIKSIGANGVVLGALTEENEICRHTLEELLVECKGLDVTFHRAIDETANPSQSAHLLSEYKEVTSILTSGGHGDFSERLKVISEMKKMSGHIDILVGGGLNKGNILSIHSRVETGHYHFGTAVRKNNSSVAGIDLQAAKELSRMLKGNVY
ncbi:copper homeostasis protein CutC [Neobacillus notoginsengisoli]|uniref:PF03932 family protein CutC n=1 Tax=Neobacillus notoginsengisoli TaxID=1578198 RepID=A0A417YLM9_9BACI|nr:copper homeostasis protein CutC [Neobacillus notoginsengisoli]